MHGIRKEAEGHSQQLGFGVAAGSGIGAAAENPLDRRGGGLRVWGAIWEGDRGDCAWVFSSLRGIPVGHWSCLPPHISPLWVHFLTSRPWSGSFHCLLSSPSLSCLDCFSGFLHSFWSGLFQLALHVVGKVGDISSTGELRIGGGPIILRVCCSWQSMSWGQLMGSLTLS